MKRIAAALALIALAYACAPTPAPTTSETPPADGGVSADAAACAARGGEIQRVGRMQSERCVIRYPDAGKACTDKADCTGRCLGPPQNASSAAVSGVCETNDSGWVCNAIIEHGRVVSSICVD